MKYRKKPVVIDAIRFTGEVDPVIEWARSLGKQPDEYVMSPCAGYGLKIQTLEGDMIASPGDYVIRGVSGEFYPCKPDIFEQTYEPAGTDGGDASGGKSLE